MCFSKKLVIAVFGKTCSGKTTVSDALAEKLSIHCRHCGSVLKEEASRLGVPPMELILEVHRKIDSETRLLAEKNSDGLIVIEGTFLNYVLKGVPNVVLIELLCEDEVRSIRFVGRGGALGGMHIRDAADDKLARLLYENVAMASTYQIDVTKLSVADVTNQICAKIKVKS